MAHAEDAPRGGAVHWGMLLAGSGAFLWVAYLDQLPRLFPPGEGLGVAAAVLAAAYLLGYLAFAHAPAGLAYAEGLGFAALCERVYGRSCLARVIVPATAATQVAWLSVAILYGASLMDEGLTLLPVLGRGVFEARGSGGPPVAGMAGYSTLAVLCVLIALAGRYLCKVITALMNVYNPVLFVLTLGLAAYALGAGGPGRLTPGRLDPGMPARADVVLGFLAANFAGVVDWSRACRSRREMRTTGVLVVVGVPLLVSAAALAVSAAGGVAPEAVGPPGSGPGAFLGGVAPLAGPTATAVLCMAYGLAALAPGCFAAYLLSTRLRDFTPASSRTLWASAGAVLAWLLILLGVRDHIPLVLTLAGVLAAPLAAGLTVEGLRSRGGVGPTATASRAPAVLSLVLGFAAGFGVVVLREVGGPVPTPLLLPVLTSYVTSAAVFLLATRRPLARATADEPAPAS